MVRYPDPTTRTTFMLSKSSIDIIKYIKKYYSKTMKDIVEHWVNRDVRMKTLIKLAKDKSQPEAENRIRKTYVLSQHGQYNLTLLAKRNKLKRDDIVDAMISTYAQLLASEDKEYQKKLRSAITNVENVLNEMVKVSSGLEELKDSTAESFCEFSIMSFDQLHDYLIDRNSDIENALQVRSQLDTHSESK
jgi:hypothetical protein